MNANGTASRQTYADMLPTLPGYAAAAELLGVLRDRGYTRNRDRSFDLSAYATRSGVSEHDVFDRIDGGATVRVIITDGAADAVTLQVLDGRAERWGAEFRRAAGRDRGHARRRRVARREHVMTAPAAPVLADLYLRLSDLRDDELDDDGRSTGLLHHEHELRATAASLGWRVARVIVENDRKRGRDGRIRGVSAYKTKLITLPDGRVEFSTNRQGFNDVLTDLTSGAANGLLAMHLDRMVRNTNDFQHLLDIVRARRLNFRDLAGEICLTDGGSKSEIDRAWAVVLHAIRSSDDTSRRITDARERQALKGTYGGGIRPFGYEPDPDAGKYRRNLLIVPEEAGEIRRAAEALLAGESLKSLARSLREREIPTVTGCAWSAENLRDTLIKPANAGLVMATTKVRDEAADGGWRKERALVRATWEPILAEPDWRAVVDLLNDESRRTNTGNGNAPRWLGSNLYRCGACPDHGPTLQVSGGRAASPGYVCRVRSHLRRNALMLDQYVSRWLIELLARPESAGLLAAPAPEVDAPALRQAVIDHEARLTEIALDYDADRITRKQMLAQTSARRAKITAISKQLAAATTSDPLAAIAGNPDAETVWDSLSLDRQRAILRAVAVVTVLPIGQRGRPAGGFDPDTVTVEPVTPAR